MNPFEQASYYFHQGTNYYSYEYLGAHVSQSATSYTYSFRTWAPNAHSVHVVGDFCDWKDGFRMNRITSSGIWELIIESEMSLEGTSYKYQIETSDGRVLLKGDPFAFCSKGKDDGASVITHPSSFVFEDGSWLKYRKKSLLSGDNKFLPVPMNIYEVHLGSFMRKDDNSYLTYREVADLLIPYVKTMGYTHIEFLPLAEFPYDGSWGYQVCAFYALTSRFGTPDDFKYLVNLAHKSGIGIILDWVSAHFPKDAWGLYEFDGQPLYEYQDKSRMASDSWGTHYFDLGRPEIQSFLISNALYFLREFHIDGLRVDAVASMLYLDYDRRPGEWQPNTFGGRESLEAIAFFKKLNTAVLTEFPDCLMIAEESTDFKGVTHPVSEGGLGFSMKWNMGFANDIYAYVSRDPIYRKYHHSALNFPLMYAFKENYILPISHDEVVHGKRSYVDKMYGSYEDKFLQARAALLLTMCYPGKKLLFMGTEFAQFREWDYDNSLEWFMLDYAKHRQFRDYVASLNRFYLKTKPLWALDFNSEGFSWIDADDSSRNAVSFYRFDEKGNRIGVIITFSGTDQKFDLPVDSNKEIEILFQSSPYLSANITYHTDNKKKTATIHLPAFSGIVFKYRSNRKQIYLKK